MIAERKARHRLPLHVPGAQPRKSEFPSQLSDGPMDQIFSCDYLEDAIEIRVCGATITPGYVSFPANCGSNTALVRNNARRFGSKQNSVAVVPVGRPDVVPGNAADQ